MTSTPTRPVDNVVIATNGLQVRNINTQAGTTVENKGKLILVLPSSLPINTIFLFVFWLTFLCRMWVLFFAIDIQPFVSHPLCLLVLHFALQIVMLLCFDCVLVDIL